MIRTALWALIFITTFAVTSISAQSKDSYSAILIENLPWTEARDRLRDTTIVVIPLGAESGSMDPIFH